MDAIVKRNVYPLAIRSVIGMRDGAMEIVGVRAVGFAWKMV